MIDEPAFPLVSTEYSDEHGFWSGLTKRELFAAMAMQGLCTRVVPVTGVTSDKEYSVLRARAAVKHADALMAELEKDDDVVHR